MTDRNREGLLLPVLIPVGALVAIGAVLYGFSRVLLHTRQAAATVVALVAAASVMGVATFAASRKRVSGASLVSMVGAVAGIAMLAGGIAIAAAPPEEEGPSPPTVSILAPDGAASTGFGTTKVAWPSDTPVELVFDNQDTQTHNVVITTADPSKDPAAETLFRQAPFLGPKTVTWPVDALAPGTYFFYCEVHPTVMTGTIKAAPGAGGLTITAQGLAFDKSELDLPANKKTTLTFVNKDQTSHNVSIYEDQTYSTPLFQEDPQMGPDVVTYHLPALEPGTYYFKCDIHSSMNGIVVVKEAGGGGQGGGSGGAGSP